MEKWVKDAKQRYARVKVQLSTERQKRQDCSLSAANDHKGQLWKWKISLNLYKNR